MTKEPTIQDVLDVMDTKFTKVDKNIQDILDAMNIFASNVDRRFDLLEGRVGNIESSMVTKEYLDDKLFKVRGEIVDFARKQDQKLEIVVKELVKRNIFDDATEARIMAV